MIRDGDRKLAGLLIRLRIWRLEEQMRCWRIRPSKGTRWLWRWMRARQAKEDRPYHHAPCCPANRWGEQELVFKRCNCGAVKRGIVSRASYRG